MTYTSALPTNLEPGCHNIMIRQMADCDNTTADGDSPSDCRKDFNFVVYPTPPVISAPTNTCDAMFTLPNVTPVDEFTVEYSIDGGAWEANPTTTTPGCHTVSARYVTASPCGTMPFNIIPAGSFSDGGTSSCVAPSNTVNVVIFPEAPVLTAPSNTCAAAFALPTVTPVPGFNVQWSIDGDVFTGSPVLPTTPDCYNIRAQYVLAADCGATLAGATGTGDCGISNTVNVVIYPQAPTITAPANTCNSAFALPVVAAVPSFTVEYSIDGGTFAPAPVVPNTAGCHTVAVRYALTADCGADPENVIDAGSAGSGACATSNVVSVVIFPAAPTLTQPASTCNAMFILPAVTPVSGFTVEYELNGSGSWDANPSTTLAGCYTVRARYVLATTCGTNSVGAASSDAACAASAPVNALIYPDAPIITAPANTCNAAFTLPIAPSFVGFTVQYRIENTPNSILIDWTASPLLPTTPGCYTIQVRYVNNLACGSIPSFTGGPGDCATSNTVRTVIFPEAPQIGWSSGVDVDRQRCPDGGLTLTLYNPFPPNFLTYTNSEFNIQFSWNGIWLPAGPFLSDFVFPTDWFTVGCKEVVARYVLRNDCGSTLAGTSAESISPACGLGNNLFLHNSPPPPTITATDNTCGTMFSLPAVAPVPGYTVEYSIDNGTTWLANPSTITPGCYNVQARYVLAASCGSFPVGTPALPACQASNAVQMTIFPDVTSTITSVTKTATCGTTNISVNWSAVPAVIPNFELRYSLDGGAYSATLPTNVEPGCHTLEARYVLTAACGATPAGTVSPGADCGATRTFIVWPDLSATRPSVSMQANCGNYTNIATVGFTIPVSIPSGMEVVYSGTNNGLPFGPVNLADLQAIDFVPGCHSIRARVRATTACGVGPDGASVGDIAPTDCTSLGRGFITFPAPPTLTITPVCDGGNLTATASPSAPTDYEWRYRLINTTTNAVVGGWQTSSTWVAPPVGCYSVEVVAVRISDCFGISATPATPIYPSNIQNPLNMQTPAIVDALPTSFNAACVGSQDAFVLPAPPMAITPNNITVCLGDNGKIDLQYLEQMVPACLVDPVTGISTVGAVVSYIVTSSDPLVVAPGTLNSLPNNAPELMWMGENGNNFPNVVTIGVTPQITLDGVTCAGAEVKFSITVQPNFAPTGGWVSSPNTAVQCANNNGWTLSTTANTDAACTYELYYNLSTSPLAAPIGNALVQTIAGNGGPVSFQPVFIPGTYQIWQRCGGCAELAITFNLSIIDAPTLTDVLLETCPTTPGGNTGTFTGINYTLPTVPTPQTITVLGYYDSFNNANNGGTTGLISATAPFDYISSDAAIYVRIGHNVDGLPGDDCYYVGTIELRVVNRPIVTLTAIENPSCINQEVQLISTVVAGSGVGYTYSWERVSPVAGPITGATGTVTVTETTPGDYVYRLTVTDPNDDTNGADGPVCTTVTDITVTYTGPIITCPADFTAATDAGSCSTFMNLIPAEINAACADEFTIRYWVTGATTIASMAAPETLSTVNATAFNVGVDTVHAIVGTLSGGVFTPLAPEVSCTYTANVIDREPPIAKCKDISVFLNSAGQASVTAAMVNGGSTDNCGVTAAFICPTIQGFTGIFAPGNWNFNPGINGTLDTNNAPNSLTLSGSNSGPSSTPGLFQPPPGVLTTLCINVPASGSITFTWNYQSFDSYSSANWDRFGYSVNGVFTQLTLNDGPLVQSGTNTVTLNSGDVFCFVQGSDNVDGVGVTISNMFIFESTQLPCNFTCANLGQNDVTLIVRDAFGNSSTCLANVTVVDAIPPTLVCPANITMNVSSNTVCTWTSGSLAPTTYTDNCTVPPVLTYSILNPDQTVANGTGAVNAYVFAKGTSVVTYSSADASGNISVCTFTVTVVDNVLPEFDGCPEDITVNITNAGFTVSPASPAGGFVISQPATANDCSVNISYTAPVASDNCPMFVTQLTNGKGASIQNYGAGTHTESYLVTDMSGNTATCSFVITVVDDRDPVITCPANLTVGTDPSAGCTAFVPLQPTVSDNCTDVAISHYFGNGTATPSQLPNPAATSAATAVSGFTSGLFYPGDNGVSGTTRVTFIATDLGGNTSSCSVEVTVVDDDAPVVSCPQDITLNANATCVGVLPAPYAAVFSDNCMSTGLIVTYAITGVTTANSPATGQNSVPTSQTFNLGTSFVTYTVTDAAGNRSTCTATVVVSGVSAPELTCATVQAVYYVPANACVVNIPLVATAKHNCSVASLHHNDPFFNNGGDASGNYGPGFYTIDFIAIDGSGNTSLCTVSFEVRDNIMPTITCPTNVALNTGLDDTDCAASYTWDHPVPTDNCTIELYSYRLELPNGNIVGPSVLNNPLLSGASLSTTYNFPVGTTRVRYYVRDVNGNNQSCYFDVVVSDNTNPVFIQCPVNFTATNSPDLCSSVVNWATPIATDNCGYVNVLRTDSGPAQGGTWALGTYSVSYVATDANNNTAVCTFTVTVTDTQNPEIFCPSVTQTFPTDNNTCTWASTAEAVAPRFNFDNCPYTVTYAVTGATTASGNNSAAGVVFNLGTSTVTYTIMDGNTIVGTCSFKIVIVDRQKPNIVCPSGSPFVFDADVNVCSFTVPATALNATATDNCSGVVSLVNNFNNSATLAGAVFPVGTTTVVWTATDVAGNTSTCSIVVTVRDTQAPTVSCASIPSNPLMTEIYRCESQMSWLHPVPADNCGVTMYTYSITNPDGTVAGPFTLNQLIASGGNRNVAYDFEEGTSVLRYYVRDAAGNEGSCSLNITVVDRAMPFFTNCPTMIMVNNDVDRCSAKVTWDIPYAVDNCDVPLTVVAASSNLYTPGGHSSRRTLYNYLYCN
ncbi:MAG: HYR domain-containing protein [Saprospiraceae bacterium]|nr:HYR domain-containing protein [Saprospiraceae bacterium]